MSAPSNDLLMRARRCLLATADPGGPQVAPTAFWFDGHALWMSPGSASLPTIAGAREHECVAYVAPIDPQEPGEVVHGRARVYSRADPLGLVFHTATISAAMTALAARNALALAGYVGDVARAPYRRLPRNPLVVRLDVERRTKVDLPDEGPGVAPALPTAVPPDIRRALAGLRGVVLVWGDGGAHATPAVWDAGYRLRTPPTLRPPPGASAVVTVDTDDPQGLGRPVGLALYGSVGADGRLVPERVTSWWGRDLHTAPVAPAVPGGVVLPD